MMGPCDSVALMGFLMSVAVIGKRVVQAKVDPEGYKEDRARRKAAKRQALGIGMKVAKRYAKGRGWL